MTEPITLVALALLFGLGVSFSTLGSVLFYRIYISTDNYSSPLIITSIAFIFLWLGMTFLFIVIQ
jgi:hypothetical protein